MSRAQLTSTDQQNSGGAVAPYVAGKNFLINGAMEWAQRGTSITGGPTNTYGLDRWFTTGYGSGTSFNISQGTSSAPTGFRYYQSISQTSATSTNVTVTQFLETTDVLRMAGKTVTLSYLYKIPTSASTAWTVSALYSTATDGNLAPYNTRTSIASSTLTNTTSWTAGTPLTFTVPSNATSFAIEFSNYNSTVNGANFQFTGVQVELGSVATPFSRAAGTLQGELALCQRYLPVIAKGADGIWLGASTSTTVTRFTLPFTVTPRVAPTGIVVAGSFALYNSAFSVSGGPTITYAAGSTSSILIDSTTTAGAPTLVSGTSAWLYGVNSAALIYATGCEL